MGYRWGAIDIDEYQHYDSLAQGNLTEVVPGKLIAFPGPKDPPDGAEYHNDAHWAVGPASSARASTQTSC